LADQIGVVADRHTPEAGLHFSQTLPEIVQQHTRVCLNRLRYFFQCPLCTDGSSVVKLNLQRLTLEEETLIGEKLAGLLVQ